MPHQRNLWWDRLEQAGAGESGTPKRLKVGASVLAPHRMVFFSDTGVVFASLAEDKSTAAEYALRASGAHGFYFRVMQSKLARFGATSLMAIR